MEVRHSLYAVALALSLSACGQKSSNTVFPESVNRAQSCSGDMIADQFIVQWEDGRRSLESAANAEEFKKNFVESRLPQIRHVEFNKRIKLHPAVMRASGELQTQASSMVNWGQENIEAANVWAAGYKGAGVLVGIVDTAVDVHHAQLSAQIAINTSEKNGRTGVDDDGNGLVDDVLGWDFLDEVPMGQRSVVDAHGTHVAGIVAADHAQGPIQGVAPESKIVPASFLSENGDGDLYGALKALDYAAARGVKVINASWGGPSCSKSLQESLKKLSDQDIVIVVAAGNSGLDLDSYPDYPAAFETPSQITVAALKPSGYLAGFSNTSFRFVHLAAPGESIYSTVPDDQFYSMNGTSMAAPFVAGAAAVLRGARPNATALQVRQALLESVDRGNYRVSTQGRLNLRKALTRLFQIAP
ncbi:MAG: S8 family serine peptidase [Bdellovibrionaceae bacterium]|nr:S8 family serine peptidase [Pseudobdellovibrionaceae bacterium]